MCFTAAQSFQPEICGAVPMPRSQLFRGSHVLYVSWLLRPRQGVVFRSNTVCIGGGTELRTRPYESTGRSQARSLLKNQRYRLCWTEPIDHHQHVV